MGIRDVICRNKGYLHGEDPNVIVIASRNKCEFFKVNIAPYVNMNVQRYINHSRELRNWELKRLLDKELIDGIFVLDDNQSHNFMKKLIYKGLRMDKHIFFLKIE
ncbi:hypothetical protein ACFQDF_00840 [Ectobacillus funiculus]